MDNPNIDNPNPKKEEYIIILDYLKFGYVNPEKPNAHGKPIAQAIGVDKFTLIEVTPKGIDLDIHDKVYIGSGKRDKVNRVRKKEPFKSFEDLKERVPLLGDPVDMLAKRVRLELDTTTVKRGKNKYYMFTPIPSKHPANKKKKYGKGKGKGKGYRNNRGRKPNRNNNRGRKPQNKAKAENKE